MLDKKRIALIHATPLAMEPIASAFARLAPELEPFNLLEDSLSKDQAQTQAITPAMFLRFERLSDYAILNGAKGILFTCSAFGPAIEACAQKHPIPILKPNEAMFEQCLRVTPQKTILNVGLVATFEASLAPMKEEFLAMARAFNREVHLYCVHVKEAMQDLSNGQDQLHHTKIAKSVSELSDCDVIMLAQFSMAHAKSLAQSVTQALVLTSPDCAAQSLSQRLTPHTP
jgi:hypothetical protein